MLDFLVLVLLLAANSVSATPPRNASAATPEASLVASTPTPTTGSTSSIATTPYTFTSTLSAESDPESTPACATECIAHLDYFLSVGWVPYAVNTTITAATLERIIYPRYNVTKTKVLPNNLPDGYTTPERNEAGTVKTTITVDRGRFGTLTTVLVYPTAFTDYSNSYVWSGVTPSITGSSTVCKTQETPATVQLSSHPEYLNWQPAADQRSMYFPDGWQSRKDLDGTNYHAVPWIFPPNIIFYRDVFRNDTILAECRPEIDLDKAVASAGHIPTKTSAWYVTVTEIRTETDCRPDIVCQVRREHSETGSLITTPPPNTALSDSPTPSNAPPNAAPQFGEQGGSPQAGGTDHAPAAPIATQASGRPKIMGDTLRGQDTAAAADQQSAAGIGGIMGIMGKQTVKTEKSATGLVVPTPSIRKPAGNGEVAASAVQSMPISNPEPLPTLNLEPSPNPTLALLRPSTEAELGNMPAVSFPSVVQSLTIGDSAYSIQPLMTMGPHVESTGAVFQIGTQRASMGQTFTMNGHPVVITTSSGSAIAIVQDKPQAEGPNRAVANTVLLNMPTSPAVGGVFAPKPAIGSTPKPAAIIGLAPITAAGVVLTPNSDGGYIVSGKSLPLGGSLTLDSRPTPRTLSLTTDSAGQGVLVANGESTILPSLPRDTGVSVKPEIYAGTGNSLRINTWSYRCLGFWVRGWMVMLRVLVW